MGSPQKLSSRGFELSGSPFKSQTLHKTQSRAPANSEGNPGTSESSLYGWNFGFAIVESPNKSGTSLFGIWGNYSGSLDCSFLGCRRNTCEITSLNHAPHGLTVPGGRRPASLAITAKNLVDLALQDVWKKNCHLGGNLYSLFLSNLVNNKIPSYFFKPPEFHL